MTCRLIDSLCCTISEENKCEMDDLDEGLDCGACIRKNIDRINRLTNEDINDSK